jgi:putative phosphoribosyl transferase
MNGYKDRDQAGVMLANTLAHSMTPKGIVVVALPRGGVPVAQPIARLLRAPLDILMVRKIGAPDHPELACGAIASGGFITWNPNVVEALGLREGALDSLRQLAERELREREMNLRNPDSPPLSMRGKTVVLVDDGLATGASMKAAVEAIRSMDPDTVTAAFPVGPERTCRELEQLGCRVVCPLRIGDERFSSVGQWYDDFTQVPSEVCRRILSENRTRFSPAHPHHVQ